jgi:hypothetical protein
LRRDRRIAFEPVGIAYEQGSHPIAPLREDSRGNKTVASVVAGSCDDCDVLARGVARRDSLGHRAAGIFHKLDASKPTRNGAAVGLCHLRGGEQFKHGWREYCAAAVRATRAQFLRPQRRIGLYDHEIGKLLKL